MIFRLSNTSIGAALEKQIRDRGRDVALVSEAEKKTLTFAELGQAIEFWARALDGVGPGQAIGLVSGNSTAFVAQYFALRSRGAAVLLTDDRTVAVKLTSSYVGQNGFFYGEPTMRIPEGTALIKLTSGSTTAPRGACFTEEALVEGIDHIVRGMSITSADRVLICIPLTHGYGFDNGILSLAAAGTPLVLQPDVLPGALLRTICEREVTFFPAVPALIRALGQVAWPASHPLKRVISASAPLPSEAAAAFTKASGLPVQQFLGSTETGGISFETDPASGEGTVGFPLPGVKIELVDGAVRVHSKANRFAMMPQQAVPDYVETGDRGEWTPEGRLKLLGRTQLTANIGGNKVDLGALDAFFRGIPGVDEAAAVPLADPVKGERVVAFVETATLDQEQLMQRCREGLSPREVPAEIRVMRLPRNARGKVDRTALAGAAR